MWGTAATGDELTGKFGSGLEDTSIGDCRLVALFAEKMLRAIFGVLQHNPGKTGSERRAVKVTRLTRMYGPAVRCKKISASWW
jgi:hypothetical protein